jgi:hypothetical protein
MLDFVKRFFGAGDLKLGLVDSDMLTAVESLDIHLAKAAHENWKLRLQPYLDGTSTEQFSAETICFDDRCEDPWRWQGQARKLSRLHCLARASQDVPLRSFQRGRAGQGW